MNWHETIEHIRTMPEYSDLVIDAYFDADLFKNVQRFKESIEFHETIQLLNYYHPKAKTILEIGGGNGIAAVNFALLGYKITVVEPDTSPTVGSNAIKFLKEKLQLSNLEIIEGYGESMDLKDRKFDIVYIRQAMHHAYNLQEFVTNIGSYLKKGGNLFCIRDHVIFDDSDKKNFLASHPLHRFYGGENAYTCKEYEIAIKKAGLTLRKTLKYFESRINYFPFSEKDIYEMSLKNKKYLQFALEKKLGVFGRWSAFIALFAYLKGYRNYKGLLLKERDCPGRMYSFVAYKK